MKNDEFAFFNQQLAAMVRDGIPLETALRRLCADMKQGPMRAELEKLESDLGRGVPLREAVSNRRLPDLYVKMLQVGAQSNDLPGLLTLLADHYQRRNLMLTRLKGLLVYPAIVLCAGMLLSCFVAFLIFHLNHTSEFQAYFYRPSNTQWAMRTTLLAPVTLGVVAVGFLIAALVPGIRRGLCWRLPGFKEASLAQTASGLAIMLRSGVPLNDALGLMERLEIATPAEGDLAAWRRRLAEGHAKAPQWMSDAKVFPPLFIWTVSHAGEDVAAGFQRAAELFQIRSAYRADLLLYSALPCSVLILGGLLLAESLPVVSLLVSTLNSLSN